MLKELKKACNIKVLGVSLFKWTRSAVKSQGKKSLRLSLFGRVNIINILCILSLLYFCILFLFKVLILTLVS